MTATGGERASVIFDLPTEQGVNESERLLTRLCQRSFLKLWAYANLYTDEGLRDGKGSAKELCDALVVFGDDVLIFSDKHIAFQADKPLEVAWPRWYKRAVLESTKQLWGAKSWLQRFPKRVFLDAKCTRPLPVALPEYPRFHLVAVTRGTREASLRHFGDGTGSHFLATDVVGEENLNTPFTFGLQPSTKGFVHVFDEASLDIVMEELDTADDLIRYLVAREEFLGRSEPVVHAPGEEELVAAYLTTMGGDDEHCFVNLKPGDKPTVVMFDGSHYAAPKGNAAYVEKKRADAGSRFWDELIERFVAIADPAIAPLQVAFAPADVERALRYMAAESRFRRRMLVDALRSLLAKAPADRAASRIFHDRTKPDPTYIFLIVPEEEGESAQDYRTRRASMLHAYCRLAKLRMPDATVYVGLAFNHLGEERRQYSEDLMVWEQKAWNDEVKAELERMRDALGILGEGALVRKFHDQEFPEIRLPRRAVAAPRLQSLFPGLSSRSGAGRRERAKKKAQKVKTKSKRHNRKRKRK